MDINKFILIVGSLTIANNLVVQFIKTNITNKNTTLVAFITAIALSFVGLYFEFYNFDIVATILLGLATGLSSSVGFDKVKECYNSILVLLNVTK